MKNNFVGEKKNKMGPSGQQRKRQQYIKESTTLTDVDFICKPDEFLSSHYWGKKIWSCHYKLRVCRVHLSLGKSDIGYIQILSDQRNNNSKFIFLYLIITHQSFQHRQLNKQTKSWTLAGFVPGRLSFNSSAALVLACLQPVVDS